MNAERVLSGEELDELRRYIRAANELGVETVRVPVRQLGLLVDALHGAGPEQGGPSDLGLCDP